MWEMSTNIIVAIKFVVLLNLYISSFFLIASLNFKSAKEDVGTKETKLSPLPIQIPLKEHNTTLNK